MSSLFIPTMWYILFFHLFRQCGTFCFFVYSDNVVHFVFPFIPTMWNVPHCRNKWGEKYHIVGINGKTKCTFSIYSDNVVHFVFPFIPTMWYILFFHLFRQCGTFGINGKTKCTTLLE
jgi:hypothetical protein